MRFLVIVLPTSHSATFGVFLSFNAYSSALPKPYAAAMVSKPLPNRIFRRKLQFCDKVFLAAARSPNVARTQHAGMTENMPSTDFPDYARKRPTRLIWLKHSTFSQTRALW
jgi:hypothetical protein